MIFGWMVYGLLVSTAVSSLFSDAISPVGVIRIVVTLLVVMLLAGVDLYAGGLTKQRLKLH